MPKINAYNVLSIINEELDRHRCETLFNGFGYKDSDKRAYSEHALNELYDYILECCEHKKFEMKPLGEFIDMLVLYREKLFACRKIAYRKPGNIVKMFDIAIDETNTIINTLIAMG